MRNRLFKASAVSTWQGPLIPDGWWWGAETVSSCILRVAPEGREIGACKLPVCRGRSLTFGLADLRTLCFKAHACQALHLSKPLRQQLRQSFANPARNQLLPLTRHTRVGRCHADRRHRLALFVAHGHAHRHHTLGRMVADQ